MHPGSDHAWNQFLKGHCTGTEEWDLFRSVALNSILVCKYLDYSKKYLQVFLYEMAAFVRVQNGNRNTGVPEHKTLSFFFFWSLLTLKILVFCCNSESYLFWEKKAGMDDFTSKSLTNIL